MTLSIEDQSVEKIFVEGFGANIDSFIAFIKESYDNKVSQNDFSRQKEYFNSIYTALQNGSMQTIPNDEAKKEIEEFISQL